MKKSICASAVCLLLTVQIHAAEADFTKGPVFREFGPVADVETDFAIPEGTVLKHAFDVKAPAAAGELNRTLVSAARFVNMHARAGVPPNRISVAVVVHGGAVRDVAEPARISQSAVGENANSDLVAALISRGARVVVCGQSAAYYDVDDDLLPGVEMALSAMTAHALLQQQGYTVNPF